MGRRPELEPALLAEYSWARALALMLARNPHEAEDLVQDAMSRVLRRPPDSVAPPAIRAWLRTAMVRQLLATRRRAANELKALVRLFVQPPPVPATTQASEQMLAALRRLPPRQRACIVLRYVHDLPEPEIAGMLGVADGTVKAHLAQARERLRELMGD